ncbi:hypothetical protein [Mesorhizobium helmanticense]|uniref:Uncharacterized protein n=1 Tax=Mesorhizobium helmanticense TaxID=1776423 RepID=A0A2T4IRJ6_9HYPH|nr:hypothetical protein [Mesorhizobium helmanticense]PTE08213.1 hypothetical protein C9427_21435 [Mesorhizobium helmanticense]
MIEYREKRAIERAVKSAESEESSAELKPTRIRRDDVTRTEMLPANAFAVAKILKERRSKSPAARLRSRLAADLAKRVGK